MVALEFESPCIVNLPIFNRFLIDIVTSNRKQMNNVKYMKHNFFI